MPSPKQPNSNSSLTYLFAEYAETERKLGVLATRKMEIEDLIRVRVRRMLFGYGDRPRRIDYEEIGRALATEAPQLREMLGVKTHKAAGEWLMRE